MQAAQVLTQPPAARLFWISGGKNLKETAYKMKKNLSSSLCIHSHIYFVEIDGRLVSLKISTSKARIYGKKKKKRKEKKVWTVHRSCITPTTRGWNSRMRTGCESDCQYASETCRFPRGWAAISTWWTELSPSPFLSHLLCSSALFLPPGRIIRARPEEEKFRSRVEVAGSATKFCLRPRTYASRIKE